MRVRLSVIAATVVMVAAATPAVIGPDAALAGGPPVASPTGRDAKVSPLPALRPSPPPPTPVSDLAPFAPIPDPFDVFIPPPPPPPFEPPPPPFEPPAPRAADPRDPHAWVDPIHGPVISGFGPRGGRSHEGVDIKGPNRGPIVASLAGRVVQSGPGLSGYGNSVIIDHGRGITSLYAHMTNTAIGVGAWVDVGQLIGYEGMTGRATTPHVHFEVRVNDRPINPAPYLGD